MKPFIQFDIQRTVRREVFL